MSTPSPSGILTVEQAAALLQVRPKTVRALASGGVIPAAKLGKFWRFDETLLREWLSATAAKNVTEIRTAAPVSSFGNVHVIKPASASLGARLDEMLAQTTAPTPSRRNRPER
jgi:excisionase family DNA binding protein